VDSSGNVYITGDYDDSYKKEHNAFIVKYDSAGIQQWNVSWGGGDSSEAKGIALYNTTNVYITGYTYNSSIHDTDAFIAKYDNASNQQWNTTWGGIKDDVGFDIALDDSGNIYITGYTQSFGEGSLDAFIVKYNNVGIQQWNVTWGGINEDNAFSLALDDWGNVFITGRTSSFGEGELYDVFIVKYDDSGIQQWNAT